MGIKCFFGFHEWVRNDIGEMYLAYKEGRRFIFRRCKRCGNEDTTQISTLKMESVEEEVSKTYPALANMRKIVNHTDNCERCKALFSEIYKCALER